MEPPPRDHPDGNRTVEGLPSESWVTGGRPALWKLVSWKRCSHCQKAPTPLNPRKRDLAEESLGFSLVPSSILLWVNLVKTPGEPGDCGILGRGMGEN